MVVNRLAKKAARNNIVYHTLIHDMVSAGLITETEGQYFILGQPEKVKSGNTPTPAPAPAKAGGK